MASLAAQVSSTGIVSPSYADVLQQLRIIYWRIYGNDANLDDDTQDGQFLAALAQIIYDCNQMAISVFGSFSPATAQGTALSSIVKINGLRRLIPSNSQASVTIVGEVGAQINRGQVGDNLGLQTVWNLPTSVIIPIDGFIVVTATAVDQGSVAAASGTLTEILTPTRGWQTVNNSSPATLGSPVESDAQLRVRQSRSVATPALSILESIFAAVDAVSGVGRLAVYENDTDVTDGNGIPSHSIAVVVSGGDATTIAEAIAREKSPGTGTYGTTTIVVTDQNGVPNIIKFFQLTVVSLRVGITIQPLTGYVSTIGDALIQSIVNFVNGLNVGEDSYLSRLFTPANLGGVGAGATYVVTVVEQARDTDPLATVDVAIAFDEAALLTAADVVLTVL